MHDSNLINFQSTTQIDLKCLLSEFPGGCTTQISLIFKPRLKSIWSASSRNFLGIFPVQFEINNNTNHIIFACSNAVKMSRLVWGFALLILKLQTRHFNSVWTLKNDVIGILITYALAKWLYLFSNSVPAVIFCLKSLLVGGNTGELTYSSDISEKSQELWFHLHKINVKKTAKVQL